MLDLRSFILPLLLAAACGDNVTTAPTRDVGGDAFVLGTRVFDDATTTSYFHVVDSLAAGTPVELGDAIEVSGAAKLFAIGDLGWFAIGGGEAPTISRYALGDDNRLEPGETISLQPFGVTGLWDTLYVVSPTKVYYPDRDNQQLIVWDPTAMAVTGTIPLPEGNREGFLSLYGYTPILRGDQLLFTVGWFDWSANDRVLDETGLFVIDTTTDTVARFDADPRCGGITTGFEVADGDFYLVSSALAAVAHELGRLPTAPCALRIPANAQGFDPTYHVALDSLTAGALAGEPVSGGGDRIFLRVFDEDAAAIPDAPATYDVTGLPAWDWWLWDVGTDQATKVDTLPASTADVVWFAVDDRIFGTQTTADYTSTTLIDLSDAAGPSPALEAPGFLHGVARVR